MLSPLTNSMISFGGPSGTRKAGSVGSSATLGLLVEVELASAVDGADVFEHPTANSASSANIEGLNALLGNPVDRNVITETPLKINVATENNPPNTRFTSTQVGGVWETLEIRMEITMILRRNPASHWKCQDRLFKMSRTVRTQRS